MTFEEVEKTMAFILEQQAQTAVNQAKADGRIDRLERIVLLGVRNVRRERKETREKINALIAAQTRAEERHAETEEETRDKIKALIAAQTRAEERQAETEEKMAILTTTMTDLAQALISTNQRIDTLESNRKK